MGNRFPGEFRDKRISTNNDHSRYKPISVCVETKQSSAVISILMGESILIIKLYSDGTWEQI